MMGLDVIHDLLVKFNGLQHKGLLNEPFSAVGEQQRNMVDLHSKNAHG